MGEKRDRQRKRVLFHPAHKLGQKEEMKMKNNWQFIVLGLLLMTLLLIFGCAEKKEKVFHVGILSGLDFFANTADGFKEKMTELGYIENENIVYDIQKTNFDMTAYENILKKFMNDKVDMIFVFPTEASQQAKLITKGTGIPVVFANAFTDDTGLVDTVRQPGGDITGVRWVGPDLALQRFEIMCELVPNAKRMLMPYQKGYPIVKSQLEALRQAFAAANITLIEIPAENAAELEIELQKYKRSVNSDTDVILLLCEPLGVTPDAFLVLSQFADEHKIPVGGAFMSIDGHESVFGLTPQGAPQGRQAAFLADKILRGTQAGTIPVVSTDGYFQLNYKAAQKLGLNVSERLLSRADEVIR
jgi:putative tryptophan/tyrosine transport system substrate-binding protein